MDAYCPGWTSLIWNIAFIFIRAMHTGHIIVPFIMNNNNMHYNNKRYESFVIPFTHRSSFSSFIWHAQALFVNGVCFNCKIIDRMRDTSRLDLLDFGLKSHNLAMRSHSVPGSISAVSATNCFSAFLWTTEKERENCFFFLQIQCEFGPT